MTIKHRLAQLLPDKIYLQIYYRRIFGRKLNLKEPKTFNEKIYNTYIGCMGGI